MLERPVRQERTGWRDQALSRRHRQWGFNAPAVDIDFLMVEYDHHTAKAMVEYKAYLGQKIDTETSAIRALEDMANRSGLPFFVAAYDPTDFWFYVKPMNDIAKRYLPEKTARSISEADFVRLLYRVRGIPCPPQVSAACNTRKRGDK